jgi:teichuronic acid biosynthesis protein TuaE
MKIKNKTNFFVFLVILISVLLNYLIFPNMLYTQLFTAVYVIIAYYMFSDTTKETIYFSTLLLAVINFSMVIPITSRYSIYYFYVTLFIYVVGYLIYFFKNRENINIKSITKNKYALFLAIFFGYMIITTFISADKKLAVKYIYNCAIMASLLLMIFIENNSISKLKKTFRFLLYVDAGILFTGILQISGLSCGLRNHFEEWDPESMQQIAYVKHIPVTFFYNPNNYAVFLVLGMTALIIAFLYTNNKKLKLTYTILYFISQVNLIFTRSRTAWGSVFLVIFFCIGVYILKLRGNKANIKKLMAIFTLTLAVFWFLSTIPSMEPFYGKLASLNIFHFGGGPAQQTPLILGKKGSDNERYTLMYDVLHGVFYDKNVLGFGPGNIEKYVEKMGNTFGVLNVHSLWLEILGDFGVAFFLYFVFIYLKIILNDISAYSKVEEGYRQYNLIGASLCFALIFLTFAPSSVMWYPPFWMSLSIGVRMATINDKMRL